MTIQIQLNLTEEWPATARIQPALERACLAAVATAERTVEGEIGVSFVSEEVIRELNRRYLGRTESTDVIAVRLLVHGVLHVLGHDHPDGEDRYGSAMFRLQEELVERLTGAES